MKSSNDLHASLRAIDHKGYPAYKSLAGSYQFENFILCIDHVREILSHHLPVFISRCFITMLSFQKNIM